MHKLGQDIDIDSISKIYRKIDNADPPRIKNYNHFEQDFFLGNTLGSIKL